VLSASSGAAGRGCWTWDGTSVWRHALFVGSFAAMFRSSVRVCNLYIFSNSREKTLPVCSTKTLRAVLCSSCLGVRVSKCWCCEFTGDWRSPDLQNPSTSSTRALFGCADPQSRIRWWFAFDAEASHFYFTHYRNSR
jgi:hypothetical protein